MKTSRSETEIEKNKKYFQIWYVDFETKRSRHWSSAFTIYCHFDTFAVSSPSLYLIQISVFKDPYNAYELKITLCYMFVYALMIINIWV